MSINTQGSDVSDASLVKQMKEVKKDGCNTEKVVRKRTSSSSSGGSLFGMIKDTDSSHFDIKKQKITKVLARSRDNIKEYKLTMSIESKKKIIACLHLLKLANRQLTDKITSLQEVVTKEQEEAEKEQERAEMGRHLLGRNLKAKNVLSISAIVNDNTPVLKPDKLAHATHVIKEEKDEHEDNEEEEFYDAPEPTPEQSELIKEDVVCTVKRVYSIVSTFIGSTVPEPTRSTIRECLLTLPSNWCQTANATSVPSSPVYTGSSRDGPKDTNTPSCNNCLSTNFKVLILAKESLDMVKNVSDALDESLGRAEEWVKEKQIWNEEVRTKLIERDRQFRLLEAKEVNQNEKAEKLMGAAKSAQENTKNQ
ncbi:hypothetical protein TPHA_0N01310 [Tetrapisispora phaffii CBS 4417]|uniref:Uncharacterized protein n=1 Tax=Tetrapisispora phaffii (strain ATCC 24235 / CBS 4417 / NBRC 1672 / NRRL Y-8282 / UCD 70-5) TaxID=1071381 RepID=G8C184_TETPH|nr:hypothetical protein TPHA_0N01310 [Tetrapisispora phaffii CBS 4417]CCE65912.1 hypothetical protein TPHA_0N01310 [Tetrapisispora phaffii CBS 4417]